MSRVGIAAVGDADQTETTNGVSPWQRLSLRHSYAPAVWCPTTFDGHVLAFGILLLVACLFRQGPSSGFLSPIVSAIWQIRGFL